MITNSGLGMNKTFQHKITLSLFTHLLFKDLRFSSTTLTIWEKINHIKPQARVWGHSRFLFGLQYDLARQTLSGPASI